MQLNRRSSGTSTWCTAAGRCGTFCLRAPTSPVTPDLDDQRPRWPRANSILLLWRRGLLCSAWLLRTGLRLVLRDLLSFVGDLDVRSEALVVGVLHDLPDVDVSG